MASQPRKNVCDKDIAINWDELPADSGFGSSRLSEKSTGQEPINLEEVAEKLAWIDDDRAVQVDDEEEAFYQLPPFQAFDPAGMTSQERQNIYGPSRSTAQSPQDISVTLPSRMQDETVGRLNCQIFYIDGRSCLRPFQHFAEVWEYISRHRSGGAEVKQDIGRILSSISPLPLPCLYHYVSLGQYLRYLYETATYYDVKIFVEENTFYVHRIALCCYSDYFQEVFSMDSSRQMPFEITLSGVTAAAFSAFLEFIYTGDTDIHAEISSDLLIMATELRVGKLAERIAALAESITLNGALHHLTKGIQNLSNSLYSKVCLTVAKQLEEANKDPLFFELNINVLCAILSSDDLVVGSEYDVFKTCLAWVMADSDDRIIHSIRLMELVRFSFMTREELCMCADDINILGDQSQVKDFLLRANWVITTRQQQRDDPFKFLVHAPRKCYRRNKFQPPPKQRIIPVSDVSFKPVVRPSPPVVNRTKTQQARSNRQPYPPNSPRNGNVRPPEQQVRQHQASSTVKSPHSSPKQLQQTVATTAGSSHSSPKPSQDTAPARVNREARGFQVREIPSPASEQEYHLDNGPSQAQPLHSVPYPTPEGTPERLPSAQSQSVQQRHSKRGSPYSKQQPEKSHFKPPSEDSYPKHQPETSNSEQELGSFHSERRSRSPQVVEDFLKTSESPIHQGPVMTSTPKGSENHPGISRSEQKSRSSYSERNKQLSHMEQQSRSPKVVEDFLNTSESLINPEPLMTSTPKGSENHPGISRSEQKSRSSYSEQNKQLSHIEQQSRSPKVVEDFLNKSESLINPEPIMTSTPKGSENHPGISRSEQKSRSSYSNQKPELSHSERHSRSPKVIEEFLNTSESLINPEPLMASTPKSSEKQPRTSHLKQLPGSSNSEKQPGTTHSEHISRSSISPPQPQSSHSGKQFRKSKIIQDFLTKFENQMNQKPVMTSTSKGSEKQSRTSYFKEQLGSSNSEKQPVTSHSEQISSSPYSKQQPKPSYSGKQTRSPKSVKDFLSFFESRINPEPVMTSTPKCSEKQLETANFKEQPASPKSEKHPGTSDSDQKSSPSRSEQQPQSSLSEQRSGSPKVVGDVLNTLKIQISPEPARTSIPKRFPDIPVTRSSPPDASSGNRNHLATSGVVKQVLRNTVDISTLEHGGHETANILAFGAFQTAENDVNVQYVERYGTLENKWSHYCELPEPRCHHALLELDCCLYLLGGTDPRSTGDMPTNTVFQMDLLDKQWERVADMNTARMYHCACSLNGLVYVIGGRGSHGKALGSVECYNPEIGMWTFVVSMVMPRMAAAASTLGDVIYVVGGLGDDGGQGTDESPVKDSVEVFDPRRNRWCLRQNLRVGRCNASLVTVDDRMFLIGGLINAIQDGCQTKVIVASVDEYVVSKDAWYHTTDLNLPRYDQGVAVVGERIYIMGGMTTISRRPLRSVECFDTQKKKWMIGVQGLPYPARWLVCATIPSTNHPQTAV